MDRDDVYTHAKLSWCRRLTCRGHSIGFRRKPSRTSSCVIKQVNWMQSAAGLFGSVMSGDRVTSWPSTAVRKSNFQASVLTMRSSSIDARLQRSSWQSALGQRIISSRVTECALAPNAAAGADAEGHECALHRLLVPLKPPLRPKDVRVFTPGGHVTVNRVGLCNHQKRRSALLKMRLFGTDRHAEHCPGLEEAPADGRPSLGNNASKSDSTRAVDPQGLVNDLFKVGQRLDLSCEPETSSVVIRSIANSGTLTSSYAGRSVLSGSRSLSASSSSCWSLTRTVGLAAR